MWAWYITNSYQGDFECQRDVDLPKFCLHINTSLKIFDIVFNPDLQCPSAGTSLQAVQSGTVKSKMGFIYYLAVLRLVTRLAGTM